MALLHHLLETATLKVPVLDRRGGMPQPGRMQVLHSFFKAFHEVQVTFTRSLGVK